MYYRYDIYYTCITDISCIIGTTCVCVCVCISVAYIFIVFVSADRIGTGSVPLHTLQNALQTLYTLGGPPNRYGKTKKWFNLARILEDYINK